MTDRQEYSPNTFFGKYERLIRDQLGKQLNGFSKLLSDIGMQCMTKLMNIEPTETGLTVKDLLQCDSKKRRQTLSAILYDDALWRLEAAYLMVSIGLLNVAYANLRTSLETLINAFIIERVDSEARKFLESGKVNQKLIEKYITPEYDQLLKQMKQKFSDWGVHTKFESVQLTSLFGPGRFNRIVAEAPKVSRELKLPDGFTDAAKICIQQGGNVGILFMFLSSVGVASQGM